MGFTDSLDQVMDVSERLIRSVVENVLDKCASDIACISKNQRSVNAEYPEKHMLEPVTPEAVAKCFLSPYVTMTYDEAITILESKKDAWKKPPKRGDSLNKEHELALVKHVDSRPVFVVDWPSHLKAFYMKPQDPHSSKVSKKTPQNFFFNHLRSNFRLTPNSFFFMLIKVSAMDLLTPVVGEVCGGSLREDDYKRLENKLIGLHLEEDMRWYLEIRKYGNVPSGGFGLGFERLLQSILAISNIKDVIPYPRWPHNCHM